jgi:hypothetical protein
MADLRLDDRAWTEAIEEYAGRTRRRRRRRRAEPGRWIFASALVLALTVSPFAIGATGDVLREGKRNPSSGNAKRETEIIAGNKTYGTRQSNVRDGDGGGAIYGCRSKAGNEPCIRSSNLKAGHAFQFATRGPEAGKITASGGASARPFTTNATGVATGLNADRLDNLDAARIDFRAPVGTAQTDVLTLGGLILRASCGAGPDLSVIATTTVPNSTIHVSWNKDPGNAPFYRQDNDLSPGSTFAVMTNPNDDNAEGTISYSTPQGSHVSVTFQSEEANAFGNTVACLFGGTALGA